MKKLLILFIYSLIYSQNFIYNEDDWIVVSNPGHITSMTVRFDNIIFTSNKGVFTYNSITDSFSFMNDFIRGFSNDNKIIHNDSFRDHIWFLNDEKLFFKPFISSIWREINFYELNILDSSSIINIGSNHDFIFLKIIGEQILILDPYNGMKINMDELTFIDYESIIWSATNKDNSNSDFDIKRFRSDSEYTVLSNNYLEYNGQFINITCIIEDNNKNIWLATNLGQLFRGDLYTDELKKIPNIPFLSNVNIAYLDDYGEWWMTTEELIMMQDQFFMNADNILIANWKEINNEWVYIKENVSLNIRSSDITCIDRYGSNVYVGTNKGMFLYNINKNKWYTYDELDDELYIYNLNKNDNYLFVATNRGLKIISINNNSVLKYHNINILNNYHIYDLALIDSLLYLNSEDGLFEYNINENKFKKISDKKFLNITLDHENSLLYMNTKNRLFLYDGEIKNIASIKHTKDILFCEEFIWTNNRRYATLFNVSTYEVFEYDYMDGIVSRKINSIQCDNDWVSFATDKGLILYNWLNYHD